MVISLDNIALERDLHGSAAGAPPAYSPIKPRSASLSIRESNTIQVLQLLLRDIDGLREAIKKSWAKGIQKEQLLYSACHEFKFRGKPWNLLTWTGSENIRARILMREIFAYLYSAGWVLHGNNDELLFFARSRECCLSATGLYGILQDERWLEEENNAWEFKMKKRLSMLLSKGMIKGCLLLLKIVETLETQGWNIYSDTKLSIPMQNVVFSRGNGWYCVRPKEWVPGMAIG
ncbi:hypothetical protein L207DRAFT_546647 [Hyaloscypha variabilis F]|uniref:Uncharacterized protein n=1 Tax=Hyaloscypha variabilis (strain UAMH 11265 / GT02V1 / F) TaxID=1149755 RepID=A0A2J6RCY4_HYAVF|nr:hypothetical protein L207DRAFT_546647 [Hyaloscypha variabilis F]